MTPPITLRPLWPKPKRKRISPRSFSGCGRCRARKIKCDETKPQCQRCLDKGHKCPGFPPPLRIRWSRKHEVPAARPQERDDDEQSVSWSPPTHCETLALARQDMDAGNTSNSPTVPRNVSSYHFEYSEDRDLEGGVVLENELEYHDDLFIDAGSLESDSLRMPDTGVYDYQPPLADEEIQQGFPMMGTQLGIGGGATELAVEQNGCGDSSNDTPRSESSQLPWPSTLESNLIGDQGESFDILSPKPVEFDQYNPPSTQLIDLPTSLVDIYFTTVCPRFSTFDSRQNLFRTFVDETWQSSSVMFYTMLSMAAAKLGHQSDDFKKPALRYQTLALQELSHDVSKASCWNQNLLFVVLMLGLSACWHTMPDLGFVHLKALRHALRHGKVNIIDDSKLGDFFENALTYWEMVTCFLSNSDPTDDWLHGNGFAPGQTPESRGHLMPVRSITPHPWTSIASEQQRVFARICRMIRQTREFVQGSDSSGPSLSKPADYLRTLDTLDEELWNLSVPGLHEIASTGDSNTPAIHHMLIAEAYMFANFYQLYSVFPHLRRRRAKMIRDASAPPSLDNPGWATTQTRTWLAVLASDGSDEKWLTFLGRSIITRVEQISPTSGTSCLHSLLLLIGSMALSSPTFAEDQATGEDGEVERMRAFVLERLEHLSIYFMSERVGCARNAVIEIFRRLDIGVQVFWMDVLQTLGVVTVIG